MTGITFGPVPSRRLGRSLGVNNIPPPKTCSYSCVYCQLGRTRVLSITRKPFYDPQVIAENIRESLRWISGRIDYITFVPDGEPTLDVSLGKEVKLIKEYFNVPVAILTNSSLIFREDVREDLYEFDLISFKIDAATEKVWRRINRPHPSLLLKDILRYVEMFRKDFPGAVLSETMLVRGLNEQQYELKKISELLLRINPDKAYLSIPIRPPAEEWVTPPTEEEIVNARSIFAEALGKNKVELLIGYEGMDFMISGDPVESILRIAAIHPIRFDYALQVLSGKVPEPGKVIEILINSGKLRLVNYRGVSFLVRRVEGEDYDKI